MGTLVFTQGKFRFTAARPNSAYCEDALARDAGFQQDADTLQWVTRNPRKAVALRQWADESAEQKFKKYFITEFPLPECIPFPDHLTPKTFQVESAWHCVSRSPAYCADEAGLGKTITACLCMNAVHGRALVICPPFLKYNWQVEIEKWATQRHRQIDGVTVSVIEGGKAIAKDENWDADVVVLPDSLITNKLAQEMVKARKWEWLFADEAHRYKDPDAQRTIALLGKEDDEKAYCLSKSAHRIVLLSGTPIPNGRPKEMWPVLSQLAPQSIAHRDFLAYGKEFCGGKQVVRYEGRKALVSWDFSGSSNLRRLRRELRHQLMIRHLKRDVLKELGPKTRQIIFLDEASQLKEFEKQVLTHFTLEELMGEDSELGDIATYRRKVGEAKLAPSAEYIRELLSNSPDKLVVFAHHIDVVEGLHKALAEFRPLMIRGGISSSQKSKFARMFQVEPTRRVIIGNMEAMGVGLTLTRAPGVVVVEPDWRPGINEQAEDRVHRMTQDQNVYIRYLVLRNSLDERMLTQVLDKQEAINQLMD